MIDTTSPTLVHLESWEHNTAVSVSEDGEHTTPSPGRRNSSIRHQTALDDADGSSQHTRISLEAIPRMRDSNQHTPAVDLGQGSSDDMRQPTLDAYLDQLQRAQEEQEELDRRLERERLEEELNISREEQSALELVSSPQGLQTPKMRTHDEITSVAHEVDPSYAQSSKTTGNAVTVPLRQEESDPRERVPGRLHHVLGRATAASIAIVLLLIISHREGKLHRHLDTWILPFGAMSGRIGGYRTTSKWINRICRR